MVLVSRWGKYVNFRFPKLGCLCARKWLKLGNSQVKCERLWRNVCNWSSGRNWASDTKILQTNFRIQQILKNKGLLTKYWLLYCNFSCIKYYPYCLDLSLFKKISGCNFFKTHYKEFPIFFWQPKQAESFSVKTNF